MKRYSPEIETEVIPGWVEYDVAGMKEDKHGEWLNYWEVVRRLESMSLDVDAILGEQE